MKVAELKKLLEQYDDDADVVVYNTGHGWAHPIDNVTIQEDIRKDMSYDGFMTMNGIYYDEAAKFVFIMSMITHGDENLRGDDDVIVGYYNWENTDE